MAIIILKNGTKEKYNNLQCNTEYPTPFEDLNLNAIPYLKKIFKLDIGFSDHSEG